MTGEVIEYHSGEFDVDNDKKVLERKSQNGITCSWSGQLGNNFSERAGRATFYNQYRNNGYGGEKCTVNFTWNFDWTKLKSEGVESITGHLLVKPAHSCPNDFLMQKVDLNWVKGVETIDIEVKSSLDVRAYFEYYLIAHYAETEEISYDEMFAASEMNDTVLVVDGKKLHVNKVFLSYHSEFFRALFFSDFKDGKLAEVPIKDVSFEAFASLLSTIYPQQVFPNDKTSPKLLELADRSLMPAVTRQVEHHLLEHSKIANEKMMWMADAYGMPKLLKKTIRLLDTVEKAKTLQKSPEYAKLSDGVKVKILDKLVTMI